MRERKGWIDYARVCAVFCVVLCHATESFYGAVVRGEARIDTGLWMLENTLFTVGRLGVPLFLAITGALLLGRELEPGKFYRKSLFPLVGTTEIWIVLNYVFVCVFQDVEFSLADLVCEMLFLRTLELSHMWYMPMIIGLYLALPFLSMAVRGAKGPGAFRLPYLAGVAAFLVIPTVNVFLAEAVPGGTPLKLKLDFDLLGGVYVLYLLGGYFIAQGVLEKIKGKYLLLAGGGCFLLNTAAQYYLYANEFYKSNRLLWYSSACIFVMGLSLFEGIRRMAGMPGRRAVRLIEDAARCSFGIYLLHKPILVLTLKCLPVENWGEPAGIFVLLAAGLGISLLFLLPFVRRWKRAGRVWFLIKSKTPLQATGHQT